MNALSESITTVPSCVTDIISLILLHCFGISCVNEHNGTGEKKRPYINLAGTAAFFMGSSFPCGEEEGTYSGDLWVCHAKNRT